MARSLIPLRPWQTFIQSSPMGLTVTPILRVVRLLAARFVEVTQHLEDVVADAHTIIALGGMGHTVGASEEAAIIILPGGAVTMAAIIARAITTGAAITTAPGIGRVTVTIILLQTPQQAIAMIRCKMC